MRKEIKGFTLIELLVVIAIIGVLAAIVLVSMSGATDSAKDARIIADLSQVRSKAIILYNDNDSSYASTCGSATTLGSDTELQTIQTDIGNQGGTINCQATTSDYCVAVSLNRADSSGNQAFCVDSTGWAGRVTSTSGTCEGTHFTCATE